MYSAGGGGNNAAHVHNVHPCTWSLELKEKFWFNKTSGLIFGNYENRTLKPKYLLKSVKRNPMTNKVSWGMKQVLLVKRINFLSQIFKIIGSKPGGQDPPRGRRDGQEWTAWFFP